LSDEVYDELYRKLNKWPLKIPHSKDSMKVLKIMFKPEEVELVNSSFDGPFLEPKTAEQIAEKIRRNKEEVKVALEKAAKKGLIFEFEGKTDHRLYYTMMPFVPGVFEWFMEGEPTDEKREVRELFNKMYKYWGMELGASDYPFIRVIPVEEKLDVKKEVLTFEKVSEFIKDARSIAVINCVCRSTFDNCDRPLEVCMNFDSTADYLVKHRGARYVNYEEAMEILKKSEEAGLVHITNNLQKKPTFICNCCPCCCGFLRGLTQLNNPRTLTKSNFLPQIDNDACTKCESCIKVCPMGAIYHHYPHNSDSSDNMVKITEERCIGCGLCSGKCPKEAITMVRIKEEIPVERARDVLVEFEKQRIH
jgi:Pyruvate/2-oxoacid:ferredoxin oxidoreductase delta subunit/DNA-binding Lrp family transcriptional regulator